MMRRCKQFLLDLYRDETGSVMLESVLVFPVQLFLTMCIVQLALALSALNVVNYASFQAARTAMLHINGGNITDDVRKRARFAAMLAVSPLANAADGANVDADTGMLRTMHHKYYLKRLEDWQLQVDVGYDPDYVETAGDRVVAARVRYLLPLDVPLAGPAIGNLYSSGRDGGMYMPIARVARIPKPWPY